MIKKIAVCAAFICILQTGSAYAKDCGSELPSHLYKMNDMFSANAEIVFGTYLNNETGSYKPYYKPMINTAFQLSLPHDSLIFYNGALKYMASRAETSDTGEIAGGKGSGMGNNKVRVGLRDFYFQNSGDSYRAKIGFLTTTLNDQLLLDERGVGFDVQKRFSLMNVRVFGSSVIFDLAREGRTCVSKATFVKRETGEEKPAAFSQYFWGTQMSFIMGGGIKQSAGDDEFTEIDAKAGTMPFAFDLTYYGEGHDYAKDRRHFAALHNAYTLGIVDYHFETALQYYKHDYAVGYVGELTRNFFIGKAGAIKPFAGYTGYNRIKGDEAFAPSFSNMFLSDRMQYLTLDNHIVFGGITYRPFERLIFEIADYQKLSSSRSMELDVNMTIYYTKSAKLKIGYNLIERPDSGNSFYHQYYFELRHIF